MGEIIVKVQTMGVYQMGHKQLSYLCYTKNAMLIFQNADGLQRILQ